jgi:predicted enzyme related to lactoylglutathione lyase
MPIRDSRWPEGMPSWVDISVPDVDAALRFYGAVLGWSFVDTGEEFGNYRMCRVNDHDAAGIGPKQSPEQPTVWLVYLASDDVDASVKLISDNGGSVLFGPVDIGDAGRIAVATDNTGGAFGLWQGKQAVGIEHYNEPGGLIWEDCQLTDPAAGRRFYSAVFGYEYQDVPGAPGEYQGFLVNGTMAGGIGPLMGGPEGTPSHWLAYFSVADADAAVAAARDGGGGVVMEPENTPFGRIGVLSDPFGAVFGIHQALAES